MKKSEEYIYSASFIIVSLIFMFKTCNSINERDNRDIHKISDYQSRDSSSFTKDSIDYIIEDREKTKFNNPIFAGIQFGDNKKTVEKKLAIYKETFGDYIYADSVSLGISSIEYQLYKDRIYELVLKFRFSSDDKHIIEKLYSSKYGKSKNTFWGFSNVSIYYQTGISDDIEVHRKGYAGKPLYRSPNGEYKGNRDYYSKIGYFNKEIYEEKEKEERKRKEELKEKERIKDSIDNAKEMNRIKQLSIKQKDNI